MSQRHFFRNQDGDFEELVDRVEWEDVELSGNAEEASVAISSVPVQDPDADLYIGGHRVYYVMETEVADEDNRVILYGFTYDRNVARSGGQNTNFRTESSRVWDTQVQDINALLHRRIQVGADAKRPAETDVERLLWVLSTSEAAIFSNETLIDTTGPEDMDEVDYTGQRVYDVVGDCAQASGKNYFVKRFGDGTFGVVYQLPGTQYDPSDLKLTNDLDDLTDEDTFLISLDTRLTRSPDRVYSGVYLPYDGGYQYVRRGQTAIDFAERDTTMPTPNVKSATAARRNARRYLADIRREEDTITTYIEVPADRVNDLREGQQVQFRATHLPGYEGAEFQWMDVLNRTVRQIAPGNGDQLATYRINLELGQDSPQGFTAPGDVYGSLSRCLNKGGFEVWWAIEGEYGPTTGPLHTFFYPDQYEPSHSYREWVMDGAGTINVSVLITSIGVLASETGSLTINLMRNEDVIESDTVEWTIDNWPTSFLQGISSNQSFSVEDIEVEIDDVIAVRYTTTGDLRLWRMPAGTGQNGERLEITGGLLS